MHTTYKRQLTLIASALLTISLSHSALADDQPKTNQYWWPKQIDLTPLRMNNPANNPLGSNYNYSKAFNSLDLNAVEQDLTKLMTSSQPWWPADFGNYGPFFIRMAWHSAGTYRITDGRGGADGGTQRLAPLNSWPDNANLDKARRLLWPIKQKYGNKISWADLMVLAGNVALESMGFKTIGYVGGRHDAWQPQDVNWGTEGQWLGDKRYHGGSKLEKPFAATQMGLIYVNPEGPKGIPDPKKAAAAIRVTFSRMGMNDEETVALIAGGHAFGKAHGAANPHKYLGPAPEAASIQQQGFGWKNSYKTGYGPNTITSGLEGAWTVSPTHWNHNYLQNLFSFDWEKAKGPGGAFQWHPKNKGTDQMVPDAFDPKKRHAPMMFTTDLALRFDPTYSKIAKRFHDHPEELNQAFAKAWFKLMARDLGPRTRYLGSQAPKEVFIWQDPVPAVDFTLINDSDAKQLKQTILDSGLTIPELVRTAWASASTFRDTDKRGGANGARIQLNPQINWPVNDPQELKKVLKTLSAIQTKFNQAQSGNKKVSLADVIVLGGDAAIEKAAKLAGNSITVPFKPGRTDALQAQTDVNSFAVLEPKADGFRNYYATTNTRSPADMLIEKAAMLNLTVPEMTALVGGMRVLNANEGQTAFGVFTNKPGQLSNDFFVNLLDMSTKWEKSATPGVYTGVDRASGKTKWQGTAVDLIFGANSELRAVAEVYGTPSNNKKFINDFVNAWVKVMQLDRFDLQNA